MGGFYEVEVEGGTKGGFVRSYFPPLGARKRKKRRGKGRLHLPPGRTSFANWHAC